MDKKQNFEQQAKHFYSERKIDNLRKKYFFIHRNLIIANNKRRNLQDYIIEELADEEMLEKKVKERLLRN